LPKKIVLNGWIEPEIHHGSITNSCQLIVTLNVFTATHTLFKDLGGHLVGKLSTPF